MTSPSSSKRSRSTPCVAGCWGPMLIVIRRVSGIGLISFFFLQTDGKRLVEIHTLEGIILPQGMAGKIVRKQDAPQIGMTAERDPQQTVNFPLHPVRSLPD